MKPFLARLNQPLILTLALCALLLGGALVTIKAQETPPDAALLAQLEVASGGRLATGASQVTDKLSMLRATGNAPLFTGHVSASPTARAFAFLNVYGSLLGITSPGSELQAAEVILDDIGMNHVRLDQVYQGLPVFGAYVVVHMNELGITAVNGVFIPGVNLDTNPSLSVEAAAEAAISAVIKEDPTVTAGATGLYVYNDGLLQGRSGRNHLAYAVAVRGQNVEEQVWIDAHTGALLNRIPLRHEGLYRIIYSPIYDPSNPDLFVQASEDDPPNLLDAPPIHNLYNFAGQVYDLFFNAFGRDSYDGSGAIMRSVYLVNQICPNAYWNGQSTNYCPGFDLDDVVAHEWGHAYTQYTHNLIYQWQSGALNESYSDIWGEVVDLHNGVDGIGGANNAEPYPNGQRWIVGEDLTEPVVNLLLRDMWNPERLGDPARVSSSNYHCSTSDAGGVHRNSGIPNHAFAMLVDGKTFNGQTVEGIGFTKAIHIYWRAAEVYQGPATFFPQHADALEAACSDLIGANLPDFQTGQLSGEVITAGDCEQVAKAMLAVEMRQEPNQCNFQPLLNPNTPAMCANPSFIVSEDWENGIPGNWTLTSQAAPPPHGDSWPNYNWVLSSSLPDNRAGSGVFAIDEITGTCAPGGDISGHFTIDSPVFNVPSPLVDLELRFDHWVATEANWDGGNLKASVNGGLFELLPEDAYTFNPPNATLNDPLLDGNTNPLAGEAAWSGSDGGQLGGSWGTTVVDLSALGVSGGETLQLRWDFGIDGCNGLVGWYVDQVQVFTCDGSVTPTPEPTVSPSPTPAGAETTGGGWLSATAGKKINFGFRVEETAGGLQGDLELNDKSDGVKIDLTQVTSLGQVNGSCGSVPAGSNSLEFQGSGTFNGGAAEFRVCVQDNGNPGKGNDLFYLECTNGCSYKTADRTPSDVIGGGNIQVAQGSSGGSDGSTPAATTMILDPILLTEGVAGQAQLFTVTVYDQNQDLLTNANVTLTRLAADGSIVTLTAVTDLMGTAVFNTVNLDQLAEYIATSSSAESNAIEVSPLLP